MNRAIKRRLWLIAILGSFWLLSLFIFYVCVTDPRHASWDPVFFTPAFFILVEFPLCALAFILGIVAIILHTRKSLGGLVLSLAATFLAAICLLNTQFIQIFLYHPSNAEAKIDDIGGGMGPVEIFAGYDNTDAVFRMGVITRREDDSKIESVYLCASYTDIFGRVINHYESFPAWYGTRGHGGTDWISEYPACFAYKNLQVTISIRMLGGEEYSKVIPMRVPRVPFWVH